MAPNKSPAFQFYPKDFMAGTATMSLQEVGAYMRLLCYAWDTGSIPNEPDERARICVCSKAQERELWKKVGKKFSLQDDALINERMEEERKKQSEYRRRQSDKGKASAAARQQPDVNHGSTTVEARLPSGSNPTSTLLSSSSSSSTDSSKNDESVGARRGLSLITPGESVKYERKHGRHLAGFCDWCCFPMDLVDDFAKKIPGSDDGAKRQQIKLWAESIRQLWSDRINPDGNDYEFWRNRWTETHGGSKPANATLKAAKAAADLDEAFR
jgi:uncharacterized protein YdaU (DUF1376 family)